MRHWRRSTTSHQRKLSRRLTRKLTLSLFNQVPSIIQGLFYRVRITCLKSILLIENRVTYEWGPAKGGEGRGGVRALCIINFCPNYSVPLYLFPDTKLVGPLLSSPAKPLPDDLQRFVMGSGDEGVILVSFGSILSEIDDRTIEKMAAAFSNLPQRVVWKLDTGNLPFY